MLMQWEKSLELGVEVMDREHRELVKHANTLFQAIKERKSDAVVIDHLKFLSKYALEHFQNEENFQRSIGYPAYQEHKKIHEDFKKTVVGLLKSVDANGLDIKTRIEVNSMTVDWLRQHIGVEDKKVAQYYLSTQKKP